MATGKYIPPALRNNKGEIDDKQQQPQDQQEPLNSMSTSYQLKGTETYFGHSFRHGVCDTLHNLNSSNSSNYYYNKSFSKCGKPPAPATTTTCSPRERQRQRWQGTLNTTANDPHTLAYIVLFREAHPFWETKREILCKSNLHLLPESFAATLNVTTTTIVSYPIFVPQSAPRQYHAPLSFAGYYRICSVRYLAPRSRELAAYLEVKFGTQHRTSEKWIGSLSRRWAVVTLDLDVGRGEALVPAVMAEVDGDRSRRGC
ncbi:conserved hypothetical protein [Histoplasma capsulatum G186AR]|uniref:Uncharacterized protein n=1 Tax=Ajellomyces capsulatus (strain G186AR / H82 / ATCC MYA-2454 / RMSCC 2432) TaxID=447093 RepID=C0NLM8_AJECG|nr:uncharacterized protein HCBG_04408 [Histoplasma capsulatum G186AR]EEH07529.1 conserved hypothetical protein [Histoplasma capsulatum G186AR]